MSNHTNLPVVALVTAYNEEETIGTVLDALLATPSIDRVQLVDDGSTDATSTIAAQRNAKVITLPQRVPVGQAIMHHLTKLDGEAILLWCDADLLHLQPAHLERLIERFRTEDISQSLSSRGLPASCPPWLRQKPVRTLWARAFGPLTGERAILKSVFEEAIELSKRLEWQEMMRGYGIVLFLNWYCTEFGRGHVITYFDELRQRQKYEKWGWTSVAQMAAQWTQFGITWVKIRTHSRRIRGLKNGGHGP